MDLKGPRPWICNDFNVFGRSQAVYLEGFQWIWRVPGLGFGMISMDSGFHDSIFGKIWG